MHVLKTEKAGPKVECPQCGKAVYWDRSSPYRPFCSERCKLIDLGNWADETNVIPGEPVDLDGSDENSWD